MTGQAGAGGRRRQAMIALARLLAFTGALALVLALASTACRRGGTAVPTDVAIDWPDAAPYELAPPQAAPDGAAGNGAAGNAAADSARPENKLDGGTGD